MPEFPPVGAMRGTDNAALASEYTAARAIALEFHGRSLEGYTPTVATVSSNDATYVTVLNITGRGILMSLGTYIDVANREIIVKLTLDSVVVIDEVAMLFGGDAKATSSLNMLMAFDTTCLLEMKGDSTMFASFFYGVALVE